MHSWHYSDWCCRWANRRRTFVSDGPHPPWWLPHQTTCQKSGRNKGQRNSPQHSCVEQDDFLQGHHGPHLLVCVQRFDRLPGLREQTDGGTHSEMHEGHRCKMKSLACWGSSLASTQKDLQKNIDDEIWWRCQNHPRFFCIVLQYLTFHPNHWALTQTSHGESTTVG